MGNGDEKPSEPIADARSHPHPHLHLQDSVNPFRSHVSLPKVANHRRRWVHLFPNIGMDRIPAGSSPITITISIAIAISLGHGAEDRLNLRSLCMPAILPLTTDYFPNADELQKSFMSNVHTLSLIPNENRYHNRVDYLLSELVTQRLTQDFQLTVRLFVMGMGMGWRWA